MKTIRCLLFVLTLALPIAVNAAQPEVAPAPAVENPWDAIKELNYQQRADFIAGANRLVEKIADDIRQLNEKRANLPETSVKEWDFAMKEVKDAHAYLKAMIAELSDATVETWVQAKEKVGKAWQRALDACDKVKATTTS